MSDLKAKMHQIRFGWGSTPDPTGGASSTPQRAGVYYFRCYWPLKFELGAKIM